MPIALKRLTLLTVKLLVRDIFAVMFRQDALAVLIWAKKRRPFFKQSLQYR